MNEEYLCKYFSRYGKVRDLYIFTRKNSIKAFIEFQDIESAKKASYYPQINDPFVGFIKIYLSEKPSIIRPIKTLVQEPGAFNQTNKNKNEIFTKSSKLLEDEHAKNCANDNKIFGFLFDHTEKQTQEHKIGEHFTISKFEDMRSKVSIQPFKREKIRFPKLIVQDKNAMLDEFCKSPKYILKICQIYDPRLALDNIPKLISVYGQIKKIFFNRVSGNLFIELKNKHHMFFVANNLSNIELFGTPIIIRPNDFDSFYLNILDSSLNSDSVIIFKFRSPILSEEYFSSMNTIHPTNCLLVENCPPGFSAVHLQCLFSSFFSSARIAVLRQSKNFNSCFLAEFESVSIAILLVSVFNLQRINTRKLQISFCKQTNWT